MSSTTHEAPARTPQTSDVIKTELIMSKHINAVGSVFGGTLLAWADVTAALCGTKFCRGPVVTASLDAMNFIHPIQLGWIVTIYGRVNASFRTSMEVGIKIVSVDPHTGKIFVNSRGYFTIVALNEHAKPKAVPQLTPVTPEDIRRQLAAHNRRKIRMQMRRTHG